MNTRALRAVIAVLLTGLLPVPLPAQTAAAVRRGLAANLILPQARSVVFATTPGTVSVTGADVTVEILEQVATTTLDLRLTNASSARLEAEVILPVPESAVLRGFTFDGTAPEPTAEILARDQARQLYDSIVARTRDPALLEFVGCQLVRSSVFPLEPRSGQKIRLIYEHVLPVDGDRVDYFLPRTESIDYRVPWQFAARIASKTPIAAVYSPSHALETVRRDDRHVTVRFAASATTEPGPFRLSYLRRREGLSASLFAYPEPGSDGGYFLLLACPPPPVQPSPDAPAAEVPQPQKREVVLVLDRSGSMAGPKLEQGREAALQVVESLDEGEAFNVIVYSDTVECFAPRPVIKSAATMAQVRSFLRGVRVHGGTNLHDALAEALRLPPTPGFLPLVLFLTDGLPTVGRTSERAIRDLATQNNPHRRRVFTFGIGADVNTPLLDRLALDTRATSTFVLPGENVEARVGQVFRRLQGPLLAEPTLRATTPAGQPAPGRVHDLLPGRIPDLFEGDQLVVLGRYTGTEPLAFELGGVHLGRDRTFRLRFDLTHATTANAFVPRLWASRKIAHLTDAIRDLGVDQPHAGPAAGTFSNRSLLSSAPPSAAPASPAGTDPRLRELVGEIVRLSRDFGILTEYTAFFAREGTDLSQPTQLLAEAYRNYSDRAVATRWGNGSVNQSLNNLGQRDQTTLNRRNGFFDANLDRVQIGTVQQINDRAFYHRNGRWIDSRLVGETASETTPRRVVEIGSAEFRRLAGRLAAENRQGTIALGGEVLLQVDGETILVK